MSTVCIEHVLCVLGPDVMCVCVASYVCAQHEILMMHCDEGDPCVGVNVNVMVGCKKRGSTAKHKK